MRTSRTNHPALPLRWVLAILAVEAILPGCHHGEHGSHGTRDAGPPVDGSFVPPEPGIDSGVPPGPAKALARGISVDDVVLDQAVATTLVRNGAWVAEASREAPVVTQRDALVQVTWTLEAGFVSRPIEGRLTIVQSGGASNTLVVVRTPSGGGDVSTFEGAFSFLVDGTLLRDATKIRFAFHETEVGSFAGDDSGARFPANGGDQALEPWTGTMALHVMIVPTATSCAAAPSMQAAIRATIESYIYNQFPINALEVRYHAPISVASCGEGTIMDDLEALRDAEALGPEWYYQAHFSNASDTSSGGFAWVFEDDAEVNADRVSWVQYWAGEEPMNVTHELGHNHGSNHTFSSNATPPYVPAAGKDYGGRPAYGFAIRGEHQPGVDGVIRHRILAPTIDGSGHRVDNGDDANFFDAMSYDQPYWISPFTYGEWARRIRASRAWPSSGARAARVAVLEGFRHESGEVTWRLRVAEPPRGDTVRFALDGIPRDVAADITRGDDAEALRIRVVAPSGLSVSELAGHEFSVAGPDDPIEHQAGDPVR